MGNLNCIKNRNKRRAQLAENSNASSSSFQINAFKPMKSIWVIVTNSNYEDRRKDEGFEDFIDLPEVKKDAQNVRKGILQLGARKTDIIERENIDFKGFSDLFNEIRDRIGTNHQKGQKTLVFFYYAGHGAMTSITFAIVNEAPKVLKARYPLEQ